MHLYTSFTELAAYKTEDICQLMIDEFPSKYQVQCNRSYKA